MHGFTNFKFKSNIAGDLIVQQHCSQKIKSRKIRTVICIRHFSSYLPFSQPFQAYKWTYPLNVHCSTLQQDRKLNISYTECSRRKGQNFGRVFLMLKYTDITQKTYIQSWTVTEIMAGETCGLLAGLRNVPCQLTAFRMSVLDCRVRLQKYRWRCSSKLPLCW